MAKNDSLVSINQDTYRFCGIEFQGDFCHACGQKRIGGRFTIKQSGAWVFCEVFNLDRGFLFTTKQIIVNTRKLISEYLSGGTKKYTHPFRFLFVWVTINTLITISTGVFDNLDQFEDYGFKIDEEGKQIMDYIKKYMTIIAMSGIPFISLTSYLISKKRKLFYTEHLIISSYAYAGSVIVGLPFLCLLFFPTGILIQSNINMIIYLLFFGNVLHKFFKENYIESTAKFLLVNVLTILLALIFVLVIGTPLVILYKEYFSS